MATTHPTCELACQGTHGEWDLLGDYPTEHEAIQAALVWAADPHADIHRDGYGTAVFGVSRDHASGHYETRIEVYECGQHLVM